jgi:predicted house-cleaning noncanonical NTP pyrophosphatase (MazG superfamily)
MKKRLFEHDENKDEDDDYKRISTRFPKKTRTTSGTNNMIPPFLQSLQNPNKVNTFQKENKPAQDTYKNSIFNKLREGYQKYYNKPVYQNLADFIVPQLINHNNFVNANLYDSFSKAKSKNLYDSENKSLDVRVSSPQSSIDNPIITLIHEGTHGLDNLQMKTHQNPTFDFLSKHLGNQPISQDQGNWYTGAQTILNNNTFKGNAYNYNESPGNVRQNIINDANQFLFNNQPPHNMSFTDINQALTNASDDEKDGLFMQMSEFPAFAVEQLDKPLDVRWKEKGGNEINPENHPRAGQPVYEMTGVNGQTNLGRKFLRRVTKDVYQNFQNLDSGFDVNYPEAAQAFRDRITELRNKNKYMNPQDYIWDRKIRTPEQQEEIKNKLIDQMRLTSSEEKKRKLPFWMKYFP